MNDKAHNKTRACTDSYELQEVSSRAQIDYDLSGSVPLRISPCFNRKQETGLLDT